MRIWPMDELVELVRDTLVVGRDVRARTARLPPAITEVARPDARRWDAQLASDEGAEAAAVIGAWWEAVGSPGELRTVEVRRRQNSGWHLYEIGSVNLTHQADVGCVLTYVRRLRPVDPPAHRSGLDSATFAAPHSIVQHLDELGVVLRSEGDVERVFGRSAEALEGRTVADYLHPDDREASLAMWIEVLRSPDNARTIQQRIVRPDGSSMWIQSTVMNRLATSGAILAMSHDISAARAQQAALAASEQELRFLTEVVPVAVFRANGPGEVTFANGRWSSLLADATTLDEVCLRVHEDDRARLADVCDRARRTGDVAIARVRDPEAERHLEFRLQGVVDPTDPSGDVGIIGTVDDVTREVIRSYELEATAERDPLTGLANRRGLRRTLEAAVAGARSALVLFGDLDDFKTVNDEWGHAAGDQVLTAIGHRLRDAVRPGDVVGRWGGDEFLVVCLDVGADREQDVIDRLHDALALPVRVGQHRYQARVSLGAVRPLPGESGESVLRRADTAMYDAKRSRHRSA